MHNKPAVEAKSTTIAITHNKFFSKLSLLRPKPKASYEAATIRYRCLQFAYTNYTRVTAHTLILWPHTRRRRPKQAGVCAAKQAS
jgi:hypothetical protein